MRIKPIARRWRRRSASRAGPTRRSPVEAARASWPRPAGGRGPRGRSRSVPPKGRGCWRYPLLLRRRIASWFSSRFGFSFQPSPSAFGGVEQELEPAVDETPAVEGHVVTHLHARVRHDRVRHDLAVALVARRLG